MAKDRIDRDELASKLMETSSIAEDPLRAMAEMIAQFVMEAEVTSKVWGRTARTEVRSAWRTATDNGSGGGTRV